MKKLPGSGYTTSHPDYHLPDALEVGADFDAGKYVSTLKDSQVDVVYFFAKCHYGNSYYFTKTGHPHPGLKTDLLGQVVSGCHNAGIKVIAYISGGIDTHAAKQHADWRPVGKDGPPETLARDANTLAAVCLLGPYTDEWLVPQMAEVAAGFDVDGIMTDTMSAFLCYCGHCRQRYMAETGNTLPAEEKGEAWQAFCKWRYRQREAFVDKVCRGVHAVKPGLPVAFNWLYSVLDATPPNPGIGYVVGDVPPGNGQLPWLSLTARYFAGLGLPFEVMTGRFLHGLGDWSIKPVAMMQQAMVTVAANGGRCTLIDRQLPDGSLDPLYYRRLKEVFGFIHERKPVFEEAQPVKQIAILHSRTSLFGMNMEHYSDQERHNRPVEGACAAVTDIARHCTLTNEVNLEKDIDAYETVIMPEQYALPDSTLACIRDYVKRGGTVIASHRTGFAGDTGLLADVFGIEYAGDYPCDFCYLLDPVPEAGEFANVPVMIHGACARIKPDGCVTLFNLHEPMTGGRFGWGEAPPKKAPSSPGATINRYGSGKAAYIAGPLFGSLKDYYHPAALHLLKKILAALVPAPLLDVQGEPGVEVTLTAQPGKLNVNLINRNGERAVGQWPITIAIRPTAAIRIRLRTAKEPVSVIQMPERKPIRFSYAKGVMACSVPGVYIHTCVQVRLSENT